MGWLYPYHTTTKKLLVEDVLAGWKRSEGIVHATKSCKDGLWMLVTPKGYDKPIIGLYLMQRASGLWGYKDMDESMHPYYYNCPLDWLDKAQEMNVEWRKGVREWHDKKHAIKDTIQKIRVNTTYKVNGSWKYGGMTLTELFVTSIRPARGVANGWNVRIPRKLFACLEEKV
jgi:hypothetical protein